MITNTYQSSYSKIETLCNEICSAKDKHEIKIKIKQFNKKCEYLNKTPPVLDILKELKLRCNPNYSIAKKIFLKLFSKTSPPICLCPPFVYRDTITQKVIESDNIIEHGFRTNIYKDFSPCKHKKQKPLIQKILDIREILKIELLEHDALSSLQIFERLSDSQLILEYSKVILPLIKKVPLLAEILIPFKKLNLEGELEIYRRMLLINEDFVIAILEKRFLELGVVKALEDQSSFKLFLNCCERIASLHPQMAEKLIEHLFSFTDFSPKERIQLYKMLHKHSSKESDTIFARHIEDLFAIFTKWDLKNFSGFLKKSLFICKLGCASTNAFFKFVLCRPELPFRNDFDTFITFYNLLIQHGGTDIPEQFLQVYKQLDFHLILFDEPTDEVFLERIDAFCKMGEYPTDALTSWLCDSGIDDLIIKKEMRLSLYEKLLINGTKNTLYLLIQKSDPIGFQEQIIASNEVELDSLNNQHSLNVQKALLILSCRKRIEKERDPQKKQSMNNWLINVQDWCHFPLDTPFERGKSFEEKKLLSLELRRLLSLIFDYSDPEYRINLSDQFFNTKKLLFSPSNATSPKTRSIEEFSRLLLSRACQRNLKKKDAQIIFESICKNRSLFKDTQKLNPLLDFLNIMRKKLSEETLHLATTALLKALSSKKKAVADIKSLGSFFVLFGAELFPKILNEYNENLKCDSIFKKNFTHLFSLSLTDDVLTLYEKTFEQFRDPKAIFLYAACLRGLQKNYKQEFVLAQQTLKTYVEAVLTDNFPQMRLKKGHNLHLDYILEKNPLLRPLWEEKASFRTFKASSKSFEIGISQDCEDLLLCGTEVNGSCLKVYDDCHFNKALGGYLIGDVLLIAVKAKDSRELVARSVIRILWCKKLLQPVLLIEKIYKNNKDETIENEIRKEAILLAKKFNLPLLTRHVKFQETVPYLGNALFLGGLNAFIYSDAAGKQFEGLFNAQNPIAFNNLHQVVNFEAELKEDESNQN